VTDADAIETDIHAVECESGRAAVVRLGGTLTVETAPVARAALLTAVAAEPAVVVAAVGALTVADEVVLTLFPYVARHAAAWPGIPLVLAEPSRQLAAALERTAVARYVPVAASVSLACRSVDRSPPCRFTRRMPAGPAAVAAARALVRACCARWKAGGVVDTAELIVSELVSNAVRHSGGTVEVGVAVRQRHLHLCIRDRSSAPPRLGLGDGRGLLLVEALTVGWGCTAVGDGKVVWASLRLP
jgi:hypothetical protein